MSGRQETRSGPWADLLRCSWCAKTPSEVKTMIAGPGVYICDECVDLCKAIVDEAVSPANSGE